MKRRRKFHFFRLDAEEIVSGGIVTVVVSLLIALVVSAVMNESNRINEGEVIDKWYNAAYTTTTQGGGIWYHPEEYWLEIEGQKNGETVQYRFKVPEVEYVEYQIGDWYGKEG